MASEGFVMSATAVVIDVAPGLWLWRTEHPHWRPGVDWQPVVTSTFTEIGGERLVIDPLAPPADATDVWQRLASKPPTVAVVLKPDHVRDVDLFVERYGARGFGPPVFYPEDTPRTPLRTLRADSELPGGAVGLYSGHGRNETPLWLPEHRTLVFADTLTEREGRLRVWASEWHDERALPALRALLDLPFERVIISHGEPLHSRAEFEAALELPPWPSTSLHLAALAGSIGLVRRLVEGGADLNARDDQHNATPLEWARHAQQQEVVQYLESLGRK
jgi:hypothetical protein